ncbi:MAG: hypothetical protein F4X45_00120 [Chloroflexi bacterium]|nr:hypothetical protein [Chloroflexota bacterium]
MTGLAMWVCGAILAGSACQNAVASALSAKGNWNSLRQYIRQWLYDGSDRARPCRTELDVTLCFAPLLRWVLALWRSERLALAIDPTLKGDQTTAIVISVLYRSCAIPVAWRRWIHISSATPDLNRLQLGSGTPGTCGECCCKPGTRAGSVRWAPGSGPSCEAADGGKRLPAQRFVSQPDTAWIGQGTAFSTAKAKRHCTLLVVWYAEQEEPWIILTDLAPDTVGPSWYALRFWIELGFKAIKSLGWKWDKTQRTDPERISRHWLVLSVATLLALAYGTRVEDAYDRNIDPGNLRTPPKTPVPVHRNPWRRTGRTVSVIRHGMERLRRLLIQGRLWTQLWLLPEPWPEPKSNLEITHHAPT